MIQKEKAERARRVVNGSRFVASQLNVLEWMYWIREAGNLALKQQHQLVKSYENDTIITSADITVQNFLIEKIRTRYPGHSILSEGGSLGNHADGPAWILDPIDGTRAYVNQLPFWGISLGLLEKSQMSFGIFYMPAVGEMYIGVNGQAFLNNKRLMPLNADIRKDPSTFLAVPSRVFHQFEIEYHRIRSFGSLATHLAYVARGIAIGALTRRFYLWDVAGMLPILEATGIKVFQLNGQVFDPSLLLDGRPVSSECLVCHPALTPEIAEKIKSRGNSTSSLLKSFDECI